MSDDSRRSDSASARDARFGVRAAGRIRNRVLFATSRSRRNCCSGAHPIQASRAFTLNAPLCHPSSASQRPSAATATCRTPPPNRHRKPR